MEPLVTTRAATVHQLARACLQGHRELEDAVLELAQHILHACKRTGLPCSWIANVHEAAQTLQQHRRGMEGMLQQLQLALRRASRQPEEGVPTADVENCLLSCPTWQQYSAQHVQGVVDLSLCTVVDRLASLQDAGVPRGLAGPRHPSKQPAKPCCTNNGAGGGRRKSARRGSH